MNRFLRSELEQSGSALAALCRKYGVARLDVFGSATTDDWQPARSDLDFVVVFRPQPGTGLADRYLGLAEDLEALFQRPVDLITERSIRNPYFKRNVEATRTPVYGE